MTKDPPKSSTPSSLNTIDASLTYSKVSRDDTFTVNFSHCIAHGGFGTHTDL